MAPKPVVFVLHGAWHGPVYFEPVKSKLEALGYTMVCPQQPSTGGIPPTTTLYDDAAHVRAELEQLVEQGEDVVLVLHSYGGMVGTQAAAGLGKAERMKRGQKGGIVRLFYACAFLLPLGKDLCGGLGGRLPPWIKEEANGSCNATMPEHVFYHDLPAEEQKHWASKLKHHSTIAQNTPLTQVAYTDIPVTYLYCEDDQALPLAVQEMMVKQSGLTDVQELRCGAGHSPFLSQPDVFVASIIKSITA
ncbi:uncharacterized protein A1O5_01870 [Cladophialophora psammophila CBS 110553]|uniref:AB hydrolase-1 domain-containing protein n=1 Tax=Cladophialophora psammophila CBS 110553 TaxID=1182543 RepID=W9XY12_9EURO|nr:uncharacterized protein A1O5_01870 [Cladophialophora psammophila CBS 110553]EXJ75174.1 hypothetical protein A1O5_01870 [Cladophialophora psammophila CBS 110553]